MRGVNGAEEASLNAIKMLVAAGFDVMCESCWHKENVHKLLDTAELMNTIGIRRFKTYRTTESPRWKLSGEENNSLSFTEYYDACLELIHQHKIKNWSMNMKLVGFCYIEAGSNSNHYDILAVKGFEQTDIKRTVLSPKARNILFIASDGRILPCNPYTGITQVNKCDIAFENIKNHKLKDILTESNYLKYVTATIENLFEKNADCKNCEHSKKCLGGCRVLAYGFTEDCFGKDISKCAFFEGSYDKKILDILDSK